MSSYIPFVIQAEIMKRLPVKPLIQFRSVSKAWKSLIDSSDFIVHHSTQNAEARHLLVSYNDPFTYEEYASIVNDESFPQPTVSATIPLPVKWLSDDIRVGCSHGLLCLFGDYREGDVQTGMAVLWNPSIRKVVAVKVHNDNLPRGFGVNTLEGYGTVLGFGVCNDTCDPKIVKINQISESSDVESVECIPWQVEVFTLSTRAWRSPNSNNLPRKSIEFDFNQQVKDGILYWLATDWNAEEGELGSYNLIVSFDLTSEEFREVILPECLAHFSNLYKLCMSKLRDSLVVSECNTDVFPPIFTVWMMEGGVPTSFTKLLTFDVDIPYAYLSGFRGSGEPIIGTVVEDEEDFGQFYGRLVVYEPHSKQMDNLGIDAMQNSLSVYPYRETLLLHDQPDLSVY